MGFGQALGRFGSSGVGGGSTPTPVPAAPVITSIDPPTGDTAGSEVVTVWGTGFKSGDQITIDGNATTEVFVDSGQMTFTTPADTAGAYDVVVAPVDGRANSAAATFTYVASGAPPADMEFASDFGTATGTTDAALRDTDKTTPWVSLLNNGLAMQVIATGALDFPTTNVLRTDALWRDPGAYAANPRLTGLSVPAVGEDLFYRWYIRVDSPDFTNTVDLAHPIQDGTTGALSNWEFETGGLQAADKWDLSWNVNGASQNAHPNNRWFAPASLDKDVTYRVELNIHRNASGTFQMHVRVYDSSDNLLLSDADFSNANSTADLSSNPSLNFNNVNYLANFQVGLNGFQGGTSDDFGMIYSYQSGIAVRTADWCGAYSSGEATL